VSRESKRLEVFRRREDGGWVYRALSSEATVLELESIDCVLTVEEVCAKVEIEGG